MRTSVPAWTSTGRYGGGRRDRARLGARTGRRRGQSGEPVHSRHVGPFRGPPRPMTFTQECTIPVARERLWDFMMEVPRVARCVPGVEAVEALAGGAYRGHFKIQIGPIRLALDGTIVVEAQDRDAWTARMRAEANDRRLGGGIRARLGLTLASAEGGT